MEAAAGCCCIHHFRVQSWLYKEILTVIVKFSQSAGKKCLVVQLCNSSDFKTILGSYPAFSAVPAALFYLSHGGVRRKRRYGLERVAVALQRLQNDRNTLHRCAYHYNPRLCAAPVQLSQKSPWREAQPLKGETPGTRALEHLYRKLSRCLSMTC